ncbi:mate-domain-containing protein [Radiomyces spectabilis]|uniref:mate-domain-containing protein n=1 Tax=Radiomyces spectabilis TaxID=64574 RepID=UPI00221E4620|nr:mate-domain-containing protein [Radiomyces spectabilis]KAI8381138.1 mate-domain-containing protein [Radiomyces spectabilis]
MSVLSRSNHHDTLPQPAVAEDAINEHSPLLRASSKNAIDKPCRSDSGISVSQLACGKSNRPGLQLAIGEIRSMLKLTWPLLVTFLLGIGMRLTDVKFLGNLDPQIMAAVSLGNLYTTVGGLAVGTGLLTAIDTLVAQAFTGAEDRYTLGIIFQRAVVIMAIFSVPITLLWLNAESLLVYMGQDPALAHLAQSYLYVCIPFIFLVFVSTAIRKVIQCLGQMRVTMYIIAVIFPFNIASNYFFLQYLDLGLLGAAYHILCFHVIVFITYSIFLLLRTDFLSYYPPWSVHAFRKWPTFLKLGIPGMLSVSTDWAFELCAIITGVLGRDTLAAQSIILTVNHFLLMFPSSLSNALVVHLGHHLGASRAIEARWAVLVSVSTSVFIVSLNALLMYTMRFQVAAFFTKNPGISQTVVDLMGVASMAHFAVGNSVIFSGALNACGRQSLVACFNLSSYYMVGLPVGLWMTMVHGMGLHGVWSGVIIAGCIKTIGEAYVILLNTDWESECRRAKKRLQTQEVPSQLPRCSS